MLFEVSLTNNGLNEDQTPHIAVEKILTCKLDEQTGESSYCIKWADTWMPESVVLNMFPALLEDYKNSEECVNSIQDTTGNMGDTIEFNTTSASSIAPPDILVEDSKDYLIEALNLMQPVQINQKKSVVQAVYMDLFELDSERAELVRVIQEQDRIKIEKEKKKELRKSRKVNNNKSLKNDISDTDETAKHLNASQRSKRIRKPTAKVLASEYMDSIKKPRRSYNKTHDNSVNALEDDNTSDKNKAARISDGTGRNDPVQCKVCGKIVRKRRLQSHLNLHSSNGKYTCPLCGKVCGTRSDLDNHKLIHGESNFECEYCGQKFKQPAPYRIHMKTHTVEQNWMCDVCFQNFKYQGELKKHCFQDHADISLNPQQCCVCKEKLKSPISVYRHSMGHTGVRSFQCGVCSKKFKHKSHLEKHLLMHERLEREKNEPTLMGPFQCDVCGKEFPLLQSIKIHMGRHKANQENNLEEYLQKKEQRKQASREKNRQNARVYKERYKATQLQKQRLIKDLGVDPDSPIVKTTDFKNLLTALESTGTQEVLSNILSAQNPLLNLNIQPDDKTSDHSILTVDVASTESTIVPDDTTQVLLPATTTDDVDHISTTVEEVDPNMVDETTVDVVIEPQLEPDKTVEYVVSDGSTIVIEHSKDANEVSMNDIDSCLTLLNFLRHGK